MKLSKRLKQSLNDIVSGRTPKTHLNSPVKSAAARVFNPEYVKVARQSFASVPVGFVEPAPEIGPPAKLARFGIPRPKGCHRRGGKWVKR